MKLNVYVLDPNLVTLDTAHFEISLLNANAPSNTVQIIQKDKTCTHKKRQKQIQKKRNIGDIISNIVFVIIKWKTIKNNTKKEERNEIDGICITYFVACWSRWTSPTSKYHY